MAWLTTKEETWILCIQEPYFSKKGITKLPRNYGAFWYENEADKKTERNPRATIFAPKDLFGYMLTQYSTLDSIIVRFDSLDIYVMSSYCPSDKDMLESLRYIDLDMCQNKLICCLDSNAYHHRWGSNLRRNLKWSAKKRGEILVEVIDNSDLEICNQVPHLATFTRDSVKKDESHIDITLCSRKMFNIITKWRVRDETFMSDHRVIEFELDNNQNSMMKAQEKAGIPWKKPCKKMQKVMMKALNRGINSSYELKTTMDVEECISVHVMEVKGKLEKIFRKNKRRGDEVYWWTDEVAQVYCKMKLARRRMRRYKHENLRQDFRKCREEFRSKVQAVKITAWREFMSGISDPWEKLVKIIKATSVGRILSRTLHDVNGLYANDMNETLLMLGSQFFPQPEPKLGCHKQIEKEVEDMLSDFQMGPSITKYELKIALSKLSSSSAPGFDLITNNVIQYLVKDRKIENMYLKIFNVCLSNSYFPAAWKQAKVVLIPKPVNETNSTKAFRPISLTSCFSKLFERIMLARLMHYLETAEVLTKNQHAYRKGYSTQTALFDLFDVVQYALHRRGGEKSVCVVLFLDISGAFDKTWHYGILHKLLEYKVPRYLVAWIRSFLSNRTAYLNDCDVMREINLMQGCPQGGVLSPILWNVLFNEMLALPTFNGNKRHNRLKVIGYADDAAIVCKASSVDEASNLINVHLEKIHAWAEKYRIKFNSTKLAALTISNRLEKPSPTAIYYNGVLIKEVTEYKYLGLIIDNKCTWKPQMRNVQHKLSLVIRSLRGLSGTTWGIGLNIYRLLFHAIFMPIMTYGIAIWGWKAYHKNKCMEFDKLIRCYGLMATRCLKSTSGVYIFNLLRTQSFSEILETHVLKTSVCQFHIVQTMRKNVYDNYCMKVIRREVPQCIDHHYYICRKRAGGMMIKPESISFDELNSQYYVHPSKLIPTAVSIEDSISATWKGANNLGWVLFTDASISTHGIGWGVVVFQNSFCVHRMSGSLTSCTIFSAEAYALLQAAKYVHQIGICKNEEIEIRSDAKALVTTLEQEFLTDPILKQIKNELRKAQSEKKKVRIRWVPSHQNIYGNDVADKIAKKATDKKKQIQIAISDREVRHFLNQRDRLKHIESWEKFQSRSVKMFLPNLNDLQCFLRSNPSISLCQIVSGHTYLNDFICEKLGLRISPKCQCKKANESVTHFLLECELYENIRKEIWPDFEASYSYILNDWKLLDTYIQRTGRFAKSVRETLLEKR